MSALPLPRFSRIYAAPILLVATLSICAPAHAQTYYWDNNDATAGFGTAGGTWAAPTTNDATQGWSTSSAGTSSLSGTMTTTTSNALNFGTSSAGLAAGTITVSGTVSANSLTFGSQSGAIVLSAGTLSLGGTTPTITVNNAADTISSAITGSAGLTKNGTGTLTLSGNNTYTGTTAINAGTLTVGNGSTSSSYTTASGAVLNLGSSPSVNFSLLGNGTVNITGAVNAASTALTIGMGSGGLIDVKSGASISYGWGNDPWTSNLADLNVVGTIYGAGNNIVVNALTGNSTAFTMGGGTIVVGVNNGNGTYTGTLARNYADAHFRKEGSGTQTLNGTINLGATGTITQIGSGNLVINGAVQNGSVTQNGTGTLTLAGNNTYTGTTTINAGTLAVTGNISSSATTTVATGATLNGSGKVGTTTVTGTMAGTLSAGAVTVNAGGILSPNTTETAGTLTTSSLTISGGSGYAFTIGNISGGTAGTAGTDYDQIATSGAITFNNTAANPFTVYINGTPTNWSSSGSYTWNILSGSSLSGFSSGNFVADYSSFGGALASGASWTFGASGGNLTLTYGTAGTPTWAGGTGVWSGNFTPSMANNLDMLFTGAGGTATNDIASGTLSSVGTITFNSTAGSYTLAANSGSAGNGSTLNVAGSIVNNSANAQTINNALALTSVRTINTASGNITLGGAISGAGGISKNGTSTLTLSGNNTYSGATTISAGTLQIGGAGLLGGGNYSNTISNSGTLLYTSTANQTLSGVISGAGALTKNAASTLTLSGNNTYTGATTLNAGMIQIGHASGLGVGGNITFGGGGLQYGSGITADVSSRLKNSASAILIDTNGNNVTFASAVGSTNSGGLTKNGTGTLTLTNANTYSGGTTISVGTLNVTNSSALGSGNVSVAAGAKLFVNANNLTITNNITLNGTTTNGAIYSGQQAAGNVANLTGQITLDATSNVSSWWNDKTLQLSGQITGVGGLDFVLQPGSVGGRYLISGATNDYAGATSVTGSDTAQFGYTGQAMLYLGATNALPTTTALTLNNADLYLNGQAQTLASISGSGNFSVQNGSTNAATLTLGSGNTTSTFSGTIKDNGISVLNTSNSPGTVTGTVALTKIGNGTLTLSGNNTYTGATTLSAGTLEIGAAGRLGAGSYAGNISNNGTLIYSGTNNQTLSGIISGSGALTQNAASTLTLSGNNTYSGSTTINAGTLAVSGNISSSALTINSGGVVSAGSTAAVAKFNAASLTVAGDSGYAFTIGNISGGTAGTAGTDYDQIATSGAITFNNTAANPFTVYINGTPTNWSSSDSYTWNILSGSSLSGFSSGNFAADYSSFGGALASGASWTFGASGGNLTLTYGTAGTTTWAGGTGVWSGNFTPSMANNLDMLFTGAGGTATNDIASGTLSSVGTITFNSTAGSYTLAANSGSAGNGSTLNVAGSIVNNSANAQTINNALALTGVRIINTASGNITLGGAISGAGGISKNGSSTLTLSGNNTYTGSTTISAGTLQIGGAGLLGGGNYSNTISNSGTLLYTSTANQTLSGVISGAGALTKNAASTITLSGNNTYSGATTISAGTLAIGAAGRLGGGTYAGNISNNGSLIHSGTNNQTLSGVISGTGALSQNAASTLTLTGNNTYTGTTTINAGTLLIGAAGRLGGGNYTSNISNNGLLIHSGTNAQTLSGVISGAGALTQNAASTLTLSGNNTYSGGTTLTTGTLQVTSATGLGTGNLTAAANIKLLIAPGGGNMTISNNMSFSGGGGSIETSAGNTTLTGLLTNTGGIAHSGAGTLIINGGITSANNSRLDFGAQAIVNSVISIGTGEMYFAGLPTRINSSGNTFGNIILYFGGNLTLGATNAITSSSKIRFGWSAAGQSTATLNLNGYDQTVASLEGALGNYDTQNTSITGGGVLTVNQTAAQAYAYGGRITDGVTATSLTKNGSGTLMLQNWSGINSTYSGATTINSGTLMILAGNGTSLSSSSAYTVASGAVLSVNGTSQGIGSLAGAGTVQNGHASTASTLTTGADNSSTTFSGTIQNGGAAALGITKNGTGTLTLASTNTYTGATTVNGGTLQLSSNITSSALTLGTGSVISIGNTTSTAKYNASSITIQGGSGYLFTINTVNTFVAGTDYDQLASAGALTLNNTAANPFTITLHGTPTGWSNTSNYSWNIISAASQTGFNSGNFAVNLTNFGITSGNRTGTWTFTNPSGGNITLTYAAATPDYIWSGTSGDWSTGFTPTAPVTDKNLVFTGAGGTATNNIGNGTLSSLNFITFNSTASSYTLAANAGSAGASGGTPLSVKGDIINNSASAQTINMALALGGSSSGIIDTAAGNITISGAISGTGSLSKAGNSTLTLSGANTYSGATTISAGTLTLNGGSAVLDTGAVSVSSGGVLNLGASETVGSIAGAGNIGLGSYTLTSGGSNSSTTVSGIISGAGGMTKNGTGTLTLSGANTYTGSTTINAGTLSLNGGSAIADTSAVTVSSGAVLNLGASETVGSIAGAGNIALGSYTLTSGGSNSSTTLSGVISGTGGMTKNGTGTLILSAVNTYSGGTTINAGTLRLQAAATNSYNTSNLTYNINNGSSLVFATGAASNPSLQGTVVNIDSAGGGTVANDGLNGLIQFGGWFTINTNGGAQSQLTSLNGGYYNDQGANGGLILNVASGSNATADLLLAAGGSYAITKNGTGKVLVTASPTLRGITINNGVLEFGGSSTPTFSASLAFTNNGTFSYNSTASSTISQNITGTGNLTKSNTSTLTLNGTNSYTGLTTITAGTLAIGNNMTIGAIAGAGNMTLGSGFTLTTNSTTNSTFSGVISSSGALTKAGSGTLTLSGNNTYNGATTINAGTLVLSGTNTASAITVASGGTLMGTGSGGATTVSGTIAPGNSPGTLTVGALTLNSGGVYTWEMADATGAAGTGWDRIASTGLLTVNSTSGSTFTIAITSSGAPSNWNYQTSNQSWDIITYGSVSGFDATKFSINATAFGGTLGGAASTWALVNTGSALRLTYTFIGDATWAGGAADWSTGFSPAITNGANATFTGAGGTITNNIASATLGSLGSITFNSTAGAYTLAADSGSSGYDAASALTLGGNIVNNSTATQTINLALTSNATRVYDAAAGNLTIGGVISGTGGLTKNGSNLLTLSANNTYTGDTTINAGTLEIDTTGLLDGGSYSGNIVNSGAFLIGSNSNQTLSGVISGIGALTKNGTGTLTLSGSNSYSGGTTINTGTFVIGNAAAAGTGTISQANGSSLLKIDTTGTITNAMSVYNVLAIQSATLSGAITVNNATWDIETGDTLTISGAVSGNGGVTKNGGGTLVLSGNNSYSGASVVNAGTLNAANAGALGSNNTVQVNGGTLLVTADDAINGMTVTLNSTSTTVAGLAFNGTYSGLVDNLTLSKNSIIDLGDGSVSIMFDTFVMSTYTLDIYNWTGTTLWGGGTGNDTDKVYFGPDLSDAALAKIRFHGGAVGGGDSFLGSGYDLGLQQTSWDSGLEGYHIIPVPEPETYATGLLLLLGGAVWMWKRKPKAV